MSVPSPITTPRISEEFVFTKCNYFVDVQIWPRETKLNPQGWLDNFHSSERDHAIHLLNAFLYYSNELTDELFKAAFQTLSTKIVGTNSPFVVAEAQWDRFRDSLLVTHVTGEDPNNSDSGFTFARKARQILRIDEANLKTPEQALALLASEGPRPVLFVDDFVGSGDQFVKSWKRSNTLQDGSTMSFERYGSVRGASFFYCPLFCSPVGRIAIQKECPDVVLSPAHFLSERYSAISDDSIIWPDHLKPTARDFLEQASERAGIQNFSDVPWTGYQNQGLTIAFAHGIPDATLPIFYFNENGWIPLMART